MPPAPKSKAEIGLYISPEVFQLPYSFITRGVLAEIHQLSKRDGVCTAADAHFVERFDVSRDTVSRAIQQLAEAGHISKEVDKSANNLRRITLTSDPQNQAHLAAKSGAPSRKIRRTLAAKSGVMISKKNKKEDNILSDAASRRVGGASFQSENGGNEGQHGAGKKGAAAGGSTTPPEPNGTAAITGDRQPGGSWQETMETGQEEQFGAFWEVWPTKQRRKDALSAFSYLSADDQQQATARAAHWLTQHPRQVERGAAPHPATWLRGEQWNDGPEPKDRSSKGQPGAGATTARTNAAATIKKQQTGDWK